MPSVYRLHYLATEDQPEIDYTDPRTRRDWEDLDEFEETVISGDVIQIKLDQQVIRISPWER